MPSWKRVRFSKIKQHTINHDKHTYNTLVVSIVPSHVVVTSLDISVSPNVSQALWKSQSPGIYHSPNEHLIGSMNIL